MSKKKLNLITVILIGVNALFLYLQGKQNINSLKNSNSYFISDGHYIHIGYQLISRNLYQVVFYEKMLEIIPQKNAK